MQHCPLGGTLDIVHRFAGHNLGRELQAFREKERLKQIPLKKVGEMWVVKSTLFGLAGHVRGPAEVVRDAETPCPEECTPPFSLLVGLACQGCSCCRCLCCCCRCSCCCCSCRYRYSRAADSGERRRGEASSARVPNRPNTGRRGGSTSRRVARV